MRPITMRPCGLDSNWRLHRVHITDCCGATHQNRNVFSLFYLFFNGSDYWDENSTDWFSCRKTILNFILKSSINLHKNYFFRPYARSISASSKTIPQCGHWYRLLDNGIIVCLHEPQTNSSCLIKPIGSFSISNPSSIFPTNYIKKVWFMYIKGFFYIL